MFVNMKIGTRLIIFAAFMSAMLVLIGFIGWRGIQMTTHSMNTIYRGSIEAIIQLGAIESFYEINVIDSVHKVRDGTMTWEEGGIKLKEAIAGVHQAWEVYLQTEKTPEQERTSIQTSQELLDAAFSLERLKEIFKTHDQEKLNTFASHEIYQITDPITSHINQLINLHLQKTKSYYELALERYNSVTTLTIFSTVFGVLFAIIFAIVIIRSITVPLSIALSAVNRLALGDTSMQLETSSRDEIGQLIIAMQGMIASTKKMVDALAAVSSGNLNVKVFARSDKDTLGFALNNMIDWLKRAIANVQKEVRILTTSTQEIVSSVSQASKGTAETAAAVTNTTFTAEELKSTAQSSADKAKEVLVSAEETLKVLKDSENSLSATIEDMHQIQGKMSIISDSIVRLSEHSLAIGEIIETVNDLAEQSNLLAVNAAIEAAKVGEQGKSFGVVAQEIKNLAEQSKAATVQVRAILHDIQVATNAAVKAAEQGSRAVTTGVDQSSQTNIALQTLSKSIAKVAKAAQKIAISGQQQLVGIDQVTVVLNSINRASNENAEHMRQIETAVIALNEVGRTLKSLTDQYQLQETMIFQKNVVRRIDGN